MAESLNDRKIFLLACASPAQVDLWTTKIKLHVKGATVYSATDGGEALLKLDNVPPHVLIVEPTLSKVSGFQVVDYVLSDKKLKDTAVLIASDWPMEQRFVDQVVVGKIRYASLADDQKVAMALARALNFVSNGEVGEFSLRFLAPTEILLKEGEKADSVYMVKTGQLRAYLLRDGRDVDLGHINPGEFVGEMAYINHEPRSANVMAVSDCELIEIPFHHFDHLLFQKPSWAKALMATLSTRIKRTNQRLGK